MALEKVWIEDGCTGCGLCEAFCPEVFVVEDLASVIGGANFSDNEETVIQAAENCPVQVIKIEK